MRSVAELIDVPDPIWPTLSNSIEHCGQRVAVLAVDTQAATTCLHRLQVTARSTLGALALHTGGIAIDNGWLRILGGGSEALPGLDQVNKGVLDGTQPKGLMVVAFDVLGGRFAINGGGLPGEPGEVNYWGPDTLAWSPLGAGHSAFVEWALNGDLKQFYKHLRWPGWESEAAAVGLDQGLSVHPPLCTIESRPIAETSRRAVPWGELCQVLDLLADTPDGPMRFSASE